MFIMDYLILFVVLLWTQQLTADLTTVLTLRKYLQNTELTIQERNTNLYDLYKYESYRSREEHVDTVKQFSMWFKQQFPYYHDKCLTCDNRQENRFLGMIHPSNVEIIDSASRTESYLCAVCQSVSRFPRFQDMTKVRSLSSSPS